ncbi:MAG: glycogen synthase GlgA [Candidatus Omnitrophica bacterium]|nr:glycogen synthase GlgA [Candidatus Omnitrophota bacterium]MCF7894844.1 glycogen synthase GlgA [Candidatus Omnitrophota bacterium]
MRIAFCSSEVYPFAKTGGLADVSGSLPLSLAALGHQVKIFMPWYKGIEPEKHFDDFATREYQGIEVIFIKNEHFFKRDYLYTTDKGDYPDNLERFSFFSRQILKVLKELNFSPDIIHNNDWQTSLVSMYLKIFYNDDDFFQDTKTILTIHNLVFQGIFNKKDFEHLGISWDYFNMHYLEFYGKINLLKGGIIFSDAITTVSPTYARQIQTNEFGCGLEGVLTEKKDRLKGILNGINYKIWNPKEDDFIYKKYAKSLKAKLKNKFNLQKEMKLAQDKDILLFGMVSRLTEQKGLDILTESIEEMLKKSQLIILGTGDLKYHKKLRKIQKNNKERFSLHIGFDEALAHKIYAASDVFLLPSRFEPCGLSQLISFKYGAIPLVNLTGGLVDTVSDLSKSGSGFTLKKYNRNSLIKLFKRAQRLFKDKKKWNSIVKANMKKDFSWKKAAKQYLNLYQDLSNE